MRILMTGSSGFLGKALTTYLNSKGHQISALKGEEIDTLATSRLEGFDCVIHLAGENIAKKRWTAKFKEKLYNSRIQTTAKLCEKLNSLKHPPKCFIGASAVGYYGDTKDQLVDERSPMGAHFLAHLAHNWEQASSSLAMRVIHLRFGMIVSNKGGALLAMLPAFKLGLGGKFGDGKQYISWISLEDVLEITELVLNNASFQGAINVVTPTPITNADFTQALGNALHKPTFFSLPACMARLFFGNIADNIFLSSTRVSPKVLLDHGYIFKYPHLKEYLNIILTSY